MPTREPNRMLQAARDLRRSQTRSEALLWERLRARRLDGLKFRRQHPLGPFVLDFYCELAGLAIEVDGGVHESPSARDRDRERQALIEAAGIRVVRVRADLVEFDVESAIESIRATLTPGPSPRRAGRGE